MNPWFVVRRQVEFSETDMAGLVHFSNFFRYVEYAEARLFRELEGTLIGENAEGLVGWPRVRASCSYHAPLFFGDEIEIRLGVREIKGMAVEFAFSIHRLVDGEARKVARGEMTTCRVVRPVGAPPERMDAAPIPGSLKSGLEKYLVR